MFSKTISVRGFVITIEEITSSPTTILAIPKAVPTKYRIPAIVEFNLYSFI